MKGIILAGGSGTRLAPLTNALSKQVLPVYDKPMLYYPLSTLMYFDIKEILIISTPRDLPVIENLLGDGSQYGLSLSYKIQEDPRGIAEAFIIGEDFIGEDQVALILGDNIFYGSDISYKTIYRSIADTISNEEGGAYVLAYHVNDPERYGVVSFDKDEIALDIEEKPLNPKSNWAVTGLYFYDNSVIDIAKSLKPSARGELEITDVNKVYLEKGKLQVKRLHRGFAWLDTGTPESLLEASQFIHMLEKRQGLKVACIEEVAYRKNFINLQQLKELSKAFKPSNNYRKYLDLLIKHEEE